MLCHQTQAWSKIVDLFFALKCVGPQIGDAGEMHRRAAEGCWRGEAE